MKFCPTVYSVSVANIQVTNIGKCSVDFRSWFLAAQSNCIYNIKFSSKGCIGFSKWVGYTTHKVVELFRDDATVISRAGEVRKSANPQLRTNEKSCGHADLRTLAV